MKTEQVLLLGGLAAAAFFLFKAKPVSAAAQVSGSSNPPTPEEEHDVIVQPGKMDTSEAARQRKTDIEMGIDFINYAQQHGIQLPRLSETLQRGVTATGGSGSGFAGQTRTGNIARLATGKEVFVSVSQPARDSSGQTNFDRIIARNKARL